MADWYIPLVRPLFPGVRWSTDSADIWLTYDDGPHPAATPAVLDVLSHERVRALFFLIADRAQERPDLVRRIRDDGHVIGCHGDVHRAVWFQSGRSVETRLRRAGDVIGQIAGTQPRSFRPPYGRLDPFTPRHAARAGFTTTMFSINSWDFAGDDPEAIVGRVIGRIQPGDILLLHDNDRTAAFAGRLTGELIRQCRRSGLTFGTPFA